MTAADATATVAAPEPQTNCLGCNKPLKKLRRYYRDGKYFCIKRCWKAMRAKAKEAEAEK